MENQTLFYNVLSWAIWPTCGIAAGLIIGALIKNLQVFWSHAQTTLYGYGGGMVVVGIFYLILSIYFPYYKGTDMHWGMAFLDFFIKVVAYAVTSLTTTWLMVRKKYKNKK